MQLVDISKIYPQRTHRAGDISKGKIVWMHVSNHYIDSSGFWKWFRWIQHPKKPLFRLLKHVCSSLGSKVILHAYYVLKLICSSLDSKVILCAYYVLVHAVNVHRCMLGFLKWFRWIQHPKKTLLDTSNLSVA